MALAYHINVTISFVFVMLVSLKVLSGNCRLQPRNNVQTKFMKMSTVLLFWRVETKGRFYLASCQGKVRATGWRICFCSLHSARLSAVCLVFFLLPTTCTYT